MFEYVYGPMNMYLYNIAKTHKYMQKQLHNKNRMYVYLILQRCIQKYIYTEVQ